MYYINESSVHATLETQVENKKATLTKCILSKSDRTQKEKDLVTHCCIYCIDSNFVGETVSKFMIILPSSA